MKIYIGGEGREKRRLSGGCKKKRETAVACSIAYTAGEEKKKKPATNIAH